MPYENESNRPFPIQKETNWNLPKDQKPAVHSYACTIPWWLAEEAYKEYEKRFGNIQSLDRLAERGGFGREELLLLLRGKYFR